MSNYIGNAKIIKLSELPKIGDIDNRYQKSNGVVYSIESCECISYPEYMLYVVKYSERLRPENINYYFHNKQKWQRNSSPPFFVFVVFYRFLLHFEASFFLGFRKNKTEKPTPHHNLKKS